MFFFHVCVVLLKVNFILTACERRINSPTCMFTTNLPINETQSHCSGTRCMPAIGNGYIATFIMSDELHVGGVYNGDANVRPSWYSASNTYSKNQKLPSWHAKRKRFTNFYALPRNYYLNHTHRARIPSTVAINFTVNQSGVRSFALDVQHGVFQQWFDNHNVNIEQRVYAHRDLKNVIVNEISVVSNISFDLQLSNNFGNKTVDINFAPYRCSFSNESNCPYKAIVGKINQTEIANISKTEVAVVWTKIPRVVRINNSKSLQVFRFTTVIYTSLEVDNPIQSALKLWQKVSQSEDLYTQHKKAWKNLWKNANISLAGNLYLSQTIYSSLYNILSSLRVDWKHGLSPGGLAGGEEYFGHVFWDQDIWMYPPLLMLFPNLAKTLLEYRFNRLTAAENIAKKYGFKGAMFPWESALTGYEVCPFEKYGRNEIHITGDIAFAANQYYLATGDLEWMKQYGFPIILKTAQFWASRVVYREPDDVYVINDVMPPDEYQYPVNNSFFTNVIAKLNIGLALKFGPLVGQKIPSAWKDIEQKLYLPYDGKLDYHPEFEGFDVTKKGSVVKQADVILANFPLMFPMSASTKKNDLIFYKNVTTLNGPAMTHSMFTIGWLEIGDIHQAVEAFGRNYDNIQGPFKMWSEIRHGRGAINFITAAGGFLQSLVYGYAGVRSKADGLHFNLRVPPNSTQFDLNGIKYNAFSIRLSISNSKSGQDCTVDVLEEAPSGYLYVGIDKQHLKQVVKEKPAHVCKGIIVHKRHGSKSFSSSNSARVLHIALAYVFLCCLF